MSNEISLYNQPLVPPEESTANDELGRVVEEFIAADILKEVARYRIWRLKSSGAWKNITDSAGNPRYRIWEDFVQDVGEQLGCGRQHIFERIKVYDQLFWMGYTADQAIAMMIKSASLYTRMTSMLLDWDVRNQKPRKVLVPELAKNISEDKVIDALREIVTKVESFEKQSEAIKYVSEHVLIEPQCEVWYDGDKIFCEFFVHSIDEDGMTHVDEYGKIAFYPDQDAPKWVKEKLTSFFKSFSKTKNA